MNLEENTNLLYTILSGQYFLLSISRGAVIPKFNPNYYNNRITIRITDNKSLENIVEIEKDKYSIYNIDINFIKELSQKKFDELLNISKQLNYDPENYIDGFSDGLKMKLGAVFIQFDTNYGNISQDHKDKYTNFVNKVVEYFKSNDRLDYYKKTYKEKFNKDIVYNLANNEDIFKVINECVEKNIDMETYYSNNIKYDENVDY